MNMSTLNQRAAGNHPRAARLPGRLSPAFACTALALAAAGAAGCASQAGNAVSSGPAGTLRVTVIQAGGPPLPGGKTQASPIADTEVKVTAGARALPPRRTRRESRPSTWPTGHTWSRWPRAEAQPASR